MNGMHKTQYDHALFDLLSREAYANHSVGAKASPLIGPVRLHSLTFAYYWYFTIIGYCFRMLARIAKV